jgi:hypothetical protein
LKLFGTFCGNLVYFYGYLDIFSGNLVYFYGYLDIFSGNLVYFYGYLDILSGNLLYFPFWHFVPRKNWQLCLKVEP